MEDLQLSRDFWLHEWPCYSKATPADVAKLQETVARVLQPARNRWGRIQPTSWKWWSSDCAPRTGAHAQGGTVDIVPLDAPPKAVWEWGNTYLMPAGYLGRWIYEPETETQGEHIHAAPRADMVALNGDSRIQSLEELPDGTTYVFQEWAGGTFTNPYRLEPLVVTAGGGWLWPLLGLGLLVAILAGRHPSPATT